MTANDATFLLIDAGNQRIKWAKAGIGGIDPGEPIATHLGDGNGLEAIRLGWGNTPPPAQVLVSNVAGSMLASALQTWTKRQWGTTPRFVHSEATGFGINNGYALPKQLGVDRWVALIGARHACTGPLCVVDCGSAITVDIMDSDGTHLGGVIAPGLGLMRRALADETSGLPLVQKQSVEKFARDTAAAIASGTSQAAAGLVERCFSESIRRLGCEPLLLMTGGDAPVIANELDTPFELRPSLVLEGLLVIALTGS